MSLPKRNEKPKSELVINIEDLFPALETHPLVSFFVYLVILDFAEYWRHRLSHTLRWWWGAFAPKDGAPALTWHRPSRGMTMVPMALGAVSLALGFLGPQLTAILQPYATSVAAGHKSHGFALWHGPRPDTDPVYATLRGHSAALVTAD